MEDANTKCSVSRLSPIAALRNAMRSVFSGLTPEQGALLRQRTGLIQRDPEMRAAMLNQFTGMVDQVAEVLEARVGERASDFAVRNLAGGDHRRAHVRRARRGERSHGRPCSADGRRDGPPGSRPAAG